jgi:hypothetical protein
MTAYLVFVKDTSRWIDSLWLASASAATRAGQIERLAQSTATGVKAWVVPIELEDGRLVEPDEGNPAYASHHDEVPSEATR